MIIVFASTMTIAMLIATAVALREEAEKVRMEIRDQKAKTLFDV